MNERASLNQLRSMDPTGRVDTHHEMIGFLRDELPDDTRGFDDYGLLRLILGSEQRAARYGITSSGAVTQWVCIALLGNPKFDELPEVHEFLRDDEIEPDEKMSELVAALADESAG